MQSVLLSENRVIPQRPKLLRLVALIPLYVILSVFSAACAFARSDSTPLLWGGCGGVYFYAPAGELWVEVAKRDLNIRSGETHLRAILFGPDRQVLADATIPDDGRAEGGGPGPVQRIRLSADIERPGVCGMMIAVSTDRYGENASWGFRTNCPRYLVETSRGHRDARHMEPLVLRSDGREGDVCFLPRPDSFAIEAEGLKTGAGALTLYDGSDRVVATLPVSSDGTARYEVAPDASRGGTPWRLRLPDYRGVIHIDGVTRWERGEPWENLSLWTPDRSSWFDFHDNRWLLFPYHRTVYTGDGSKGTLEFTVHNNGTRPKRVALTLEFDDDGEWPAVLSTREVRLKARSSAPVSLDWTAPDGSAERTCYIRATVQDETRFSTWSSVTVRKGRAPAEAPLDIPVKLEPYRHENVRFGYLPDYPLDNQPYFDGDNRPFIIAGDGVFSLRGGSWVKTTTARRGDTGRTVPIRSIGSRLAFDRDGDVYCLGRVDGAAALLHSRDHGATFTAWPLPGAGNFDIEPFSGHNRCDGPPPIARFRQTAADPNLIWRRINDFDLILPEKGPGGSIVFGDPVPVSKLCIGLSIHSGIPSVMVSRGNKVHVTWGEATDPDKKVPGVPTFVATCDRGTGTLTEPVLVGYGPPANDVHNTPCITMDGAGFLHVLVGTHGRTFRYVRSLAPDTADGGWTEAEDVGDGLRQTYVGMVCDRNDTLHLVFRLWLDDNRYFPAGYYANLAYMSKRPGEPWSDARPLVVAPFSEYSIFYHRLTIDGTGRLFLSYDYWSTFWFYRNDHRGSRRSLMMSTDGGSTWRLAPSSAVFRGAGD